MDEDLFSRPVIKTSEKQPSSYCDIAAGDKIGQLTAVRRLGRGRFADAWEMVDQGGQSKAVKVFRTGSSNRPYYENEIKIHNKLFPLGSSNATSVMGWRGFFTHSAIIGGSPIDHPCIVFDLGGDHLGRLIRQQDGVGFDPDIVHRFMKQILTGLNELHSAGIIHTDISPGNLLLVGAGSLREQRIVISDLGSSCTIDNIFTRTPGTSGYIAPELALGRKYTTAIDIWSAFTVCYEMLTSDPLFDIYDEARIDYGSDIAMDMDRLAGSYDSDDSSDDDDDIADANYQHLLLFEKVLGHPPRKITDSARDFYNARGRLMFNPEIVHRPISVLLHKNYELSTEYCAAAEEFFLCGLKWLPAERCTAAEAMTHEWLQ